MKSITYSPRPAFPLGSMDDEFLSHRECSEWWYATGYLGDGEGSMFAFQFTLAKVRIYGARFHMLLTSLTDFQTGEHRFRQVPVLFGKGIVATGETVAATRQNAGRSLRAGACV